jgi:hypothetical protein
MSEELRAAFRIQAEQIESSPDLLTRVERRRRQRRMRRVISIGTVLGAITVVVASALVFGHKSLENEQVATSGSAKMSVASRNAGPFEESPTVSTPRDGSYLVPSSMSSVDSIILNDSLTDSDYQQLYWRASETDPAQVLVQTIDLNQGLYTPTLFSTQNFVNGHSFRAGNIIGRIAKSDPVTRLWWTEADGVEVDIMSSGVATTALMNLVSDANPLPGYRLGLSFIEPLPAGLREVRSASSLQSAGPIETVAYHEDACSVELDVYDGLFAVTSAKSITALTTFAGSNAEMTVITGTARVLTWFPSIGLSAQISVGDPPSSPFCEPTAAASRLHLVSRGDWNSWLSRLGPKVQRVDVTPSSNKKGF